MKVLSIDVTFIGIGRKIRTLLTKLWWFNCGNHGAELLIMIGGSGRLRFLWWIEILTQRTMTKEVLFLCTHKNIQPINDSRTLFNDTVIVTTLPVFES